MSRETKWPMKMWEILNWAMDSNYWNYFARTLAHICEVMVRGEMMMDDDTTQNGGRGC